MDDSTVCFLAFEGLLVLLFLVNGIILAINGQRIDSYLKRNDFNRWTEVHDKNRAPNIKYHYYIWNAKDKENEEVRSLKIRIRWGFLLIPVPFVLSCLNFFLFIHFRSLYGFRFLNFLIKR